MYDHSYLTPPPARISNGRTLSYSVGYYRGRRRIVLGWFETHADASAYLTRCRETNSFFRYDLLHSLF
ncbi:hypothetical protein [Dipodfec virus UOA04_Rod_656]|nr:hypothetical protein [Dipodfec virus UOA04_Rod_656]